MPWELGKPLNFHSESEPPRTVLKVQDVETIVEAVAEENSEQSFRLRSWGKSTAKLLHHEQFYSPPINMTPDEYHRAKKKGV